MSVSTNAVVEGNTRRLGSNTKGAKKTITVDLLGERREVEHRYDPTTQTTAAVVLIESGTGRSKFKTPYVLYTTDKDGNTTVGGSGANSNKTQTVNILSESDAAKALATAEIEGESANKDLVISEGNVRINALASTQEDVTAPPHVQKDPKVVEAEQKAQNNNILNNIQEQVTSAAEETYKYAKKLVNAVDDTLRINPDVIQGKLKGDKGIPKQAAYPRDNTYGENFGQDYMCISQYNYNPPRKDQIFSDNPLENYTYGTQRKSPLKKYVGTVKVPMPNNLTDSNNVNWGSDVMNNLSAAIVSGYTKNPANVALGAMAGGALSGITGIQGLNTLGALVGMTPSLSDKEGFINQLKDIGTQVTQGNSGLTISSALGSRILSMAGVEVSPEALLARGIGVIPNSNMELLFNAPTLREFQYSWQMSPRDEDEAEQVKKIIRFFKQGMAAKTLANKAGDRTLFLGTPNVFQLEFKTQSNELIEGVNKLKPCAVTGTSVNYAPGGSWSAYERGQPVSTVLTIRVQELEPIYATDYQEDVIGGRKAGFGYIERDGSITSGDLYSITDSEVGY